MRKRGHTTSTIEQAVTSLDGIVDSIGTGLVGDFPESKANLWHGVAGVQLDGCHVYGCVEVGLVRSGES